MNSLKSLAMNCGPLSEMIRGRAPGNRWRALNDRLDLGSVMVSRISQWTMNRLQPSSRLQR